MRFKNIISIINIVLVAVITVVLVFTLIIGRGGFSVFLANVVGKNATRSADGTNGVSTTIQADMDDADDDASHQAVTDDGHNGAGLYMNGANSMTGQNGADDATGSSGAGGANDTADASGAGDVNDTTDASGDHGASGDLAGGNGTADLSAAFLWDFLGSNQTGPSQHASPQPSSQPTSQPTAQAAQTETTTVQADTTSAQAETATVQAETTSAQAETTTVQAETTSAQAETTPAQATVQAAAQPAPQTPPSGGAASGGAVAASAAATTTAATTTEPQTTASKKDAACLAGKIICIDPGHQRKQNSDLEPVAPNSSVKKPKVTSGTAGISTGDMEYVLNLAVALKLRDLLEAGGAKVVMTRTENDVDISNIERAKIGNDAKSDLVVRIHADGSDNRDVKGISMLIPSTKYMGDDLARISKKAGQYLLNEVIAATGAKNRGLSVRDDMTGFNWSTVPTVLIEMGFMSNADEDRLMATNEYRDKLAKGLYNGCVAYFSN